MASDLRPTPQWAKLSSWAPLIAQHSGSGRIAGAAPMERKSDASRRLADSHERLTRPLVPGSLKRIRGHPIAGSPRRLLMLQSALGHESEAAATSRPHADVASDRGSPRRARSRGRQELWLVGQHGTRPHPSGCEIEGTMRRSVRVSQS